jgi:hypothetical protein
MGLSFNFTKSLKTITEALKLSFEIEIVDTKGSKSTKNVIKFIAQFFSVILSLEILE